MQSVRQRPNICLGGDACRLEPWAVPCSISNFPTPNCPRKLKPEDLQREDCLLVWDYRVRGALVTFNPLRTLKHRASRSQEIFQSHHAGSRTLFVGDDSFVLHKGELLNASDKFRQESPPRHYTQEEGLMGLFSSCSLSNPTKTWERDNKTLAV